MHNSTQAFYLKYRPQTLLEVIGQEAVKKTLEVAFKNNRLSHAYIFVGPRGSGKTSTARILAKMVNCERVPKGEKTFDTSNIPCNECSTCLSITDGSNLDLIEIDAASHRGIEDIRSLRDKIKLAPTAAKKKVYIIDEVHMLTQEAFNALLKTLEEPPAHALFILATTESSKLPQTILSRCIRLDFSLASPKSLREALEKIIKHEKIDIEEEALSLLIRKADGSFRDGIKMLDQIASKGFKIKTIDILESFRSLNFDGLETLIQNISNKKISESLIDVQKFVESGVDMKEVMLSLMDIMRNIMFVKNNLGESLVKPNVALDKYERMVELANKFENEDLLRNLNILQGALEKIKFASIPSLPLELAVLEICQLSDKVKLVVSQSVTEKQKTDNSETNIEIISDSNSPDIIKLKEKWTFVLETIRPYNFSLEALLRSARVSSITDSTVIMEVPYSFHQRILEAPKNKDLLEGILSDVLGRQVRVSTILGSRLTQREDIANFEVAEDDEIIRIASEIFNSDSVN